MFFQKKILVKKIIFCFFVLSSSFVFSQENDLESNSVEEPEKKKTVVGKILKTIWGNELESSITAMPIGLHTDFEKHSSKKRSTINGLHEALYFAGNYKSLELAGFQNSFGDLTVALFYKRAWNFTKRFSMNIGGGIMYGYDGRLQNTEGIPFRDLFNKRRYKSGCWN